MPVKEARRRIEIDAATYDMLEGYAKWLRIPTQRCATMLLTDVLRSRWDKYTALRPLTEQEAEAVTEEVREVQTGHALDTFSAAVRQERSAEAEHGD